MKGAIASVEIFAFASRSAGELEPGSPRRLSLVIGAPERVPTGEGWHCRVALADLHRPQMFAGRDSVEALWLAVECARSWVATLRAEGWVLCRDRAGSEPFALP